MIAYLLGLTGKKVIWVMQNGPKQANPLVTLQEMSPRGEAMENVLPGAEPGLLDLRVPTQTVLTVQYFGKTESLPVYELETLVRNLERPTIVDTLAAAGIAVLYADAVTDITGLLSNNQQYEPRAAVDLHIRYTAQTIDEPGYIEEVDAVIENPETGKDEVTGRLIPGNIVKGEPIDYTGAIDVDFTTIGYSTKKRRVNEIWQTSTEWSTCRFR